MHRHSPIYRLIFAIGLTVGVLGLQGCESEAGSDPLSDQSVRDQLVIERFLDDSSLTAETTESGLHYISLEEGEGDTPLFADFVEFHYEARVLYGDVFEDTFIADAATGEIIRDEPVEVTLYYQLAGERFIPEGVMEGLSLMRRGGRMRMYVPSELAFGSTGSFSRGVPPNSVVVYEVELIDF